MSIQIPLLTEVGLKITESLVNAKDDATLYDNAKDSQTMQHLVLID